MKIQDIAFIVVLALLLFTKKPKYFIYSGLICFAVAIPLFYKWIFFTAERLTWYGSAFLLIFIMLNIFKLDKASGQ